MAATIKDGEVAGYADFDNRVLRDGSIERKALKRLPVIDVSPLVQNGSLDERRLVAAQMRSACIDIGFFYITGHGFPTADLDELLDLGHRFFALPMEEKMKVHRTEGPCGEGFTTPGGSNPEANPDKATDIKERFTYNGEPAPDEPPEHLERMGGGQWPAPELIPGFEPFIKAHMQKRRRLAQQLVRGFALSLGLPEDWFDHVYRHLRGNFLYNWYPPLDPATLRPNQWSFSPHTDYGGFTLLTQDSIGGLQARNSAGDWIDVPPIPGTFVINIGDTFQMWTNDLYMSTLHRAANVGTQARISAVLFTSPRADTLIECLPTCRGPGNPPKYEPILSEDYGRLLVEQSRRTGRPGVSTRTAERLQRL